jgi:hypothetical protein
MVCKSQETSLRFLRDKGITNDINKILDESAFDDMNYKLTKLAEVKHGLFTDDLLFNKLVTSQKYPGKVSTGRDLSYTIKFAEANTSLFDELDRLIKANEEGTLEEPLYQLNNRDLTEPIQELDTYLLNFLKGYGVKSKQFDELKSKLGVDAIGATDVLNKLIWYTTNRNEETIPEEAGHMLVMLMGENHKAIKSLLDNIENWDDYAAIKKEYLPIYGNEKQVKIEAIGKLLAKALVRNYKIAGLDKTLLAKVLASVKEFIRKLIRSNNLVELMQWNDKIADHIAINILSGNNDYIFKITNTNPSVNYKDALRNNPFANELINIFTSIGYKLTGSLAIAGQGENIYRPSEAPIHDIDFTVSSEKEYEKSIKILEMLNAVPYHYGWGSAKKKYKTLAFLIPAKGLKITNVIRDYQRGNGWVTSFDLIDINTNEIVKKTTENHVAMDFFIYKNGVARERPSIFSSVADIYNGKLTLSPLDEDERLFRRPKDQEDYVKHEPINISENLPQFTYYQLPSKNEISLDLESVYGDNGFNLSVISNGNKIGNINYILEDNKATVDAVELSEDFQNQGLGKQAYIALGNLLDSQNILLVSGKLNENSTRLWNSLVRDNQAVELKDNQFIFQNSQFYFPTIDINKLKKSREQEVADVLAQRLAVGLKVDYQNITPEEATEMLKYRTVGYNNEAAFFFANTIYVVGDNVNINTVLHEFSHPLLGAIRRDNKKLFASLYTKLESTTEGQNIIKYVTSNYPELDTNSDLFKEEALAYALQATAVNKVTNQIESEGFKDFIANLLYSIKQLLKKVFGNKVNIGKLEANTSLDDLADMLLTKDFVYVTPNVTEQDLVMYARFVQERVNALTEGVSNSALQQMINSMFSINSNIMEKVNNMKVGTPEHTLLRKAMFLDENTKELLPGIQSSLRGYQTLTNYKDYSVEEIEKDVIKAETKRLKDLNNRATSLVTSLEIIKNIGLNIKKDLKQLEAEKGYETRNGITLLANYKAANRSWAELIKNMDKLLEEDFGILSDNPFTDLLNSILTDLTRNEEIIKNIYKDNSISFYVEITGYMNDFLEKELKQNLGIAIKNNLTDDEFNDFYNKVIKQELEDSDLKKLVDKGIDIKYVNQFIDKYNYFNVSPKIISDILSGNTKDVSFLNRYLESYSSSNDPIVGSLAVWINDQKMDAQNEALRKTHKLRGTLEELLPKIGFNPNNTQQIAELTTFKDKKLSFDKEGKPVVKEVYTFLNDFKDYRYDYDLLEYEADQAKESGDMPLFREKLNAFRQLKKDYFWDEYTPEVYEKDEIFEKSDIGRLAWLDRKLALDEFTSETNKINDELERFEKYSSTQALWSKYQQLYQLNYPDGTPKVDDPENNIYDLSKTLVLREHREASRKYYEFVEKPGALQTAYNQFVTLLEAQGIQRNTQDTSEFDEKFEQWKKQNVRIVYSPEYYESRTNLLIRLKELQGKVNKAMESSFDISEAYSDILDIMFAFRDEQGQPIPEDLGKGRLLQIKNLQQKINDYRNDFDKESGMTKEEAQELKIYTKIIKDSGQLSNDDQKRRMAYLIGLQNNNGLTSDEIQELADIYSELSDLSTKVPTEYYMNTFNENMQLMQLPAVDEESIYDFINSSEMNGILATNDVFAKWFYDNHVTKKVYNNILKKYEVIYERLAAYSVSIPVNEDYFLNTEVIDNETGETISIPGKPNARHSIYRIKNEYRTIKIGDDWRNYIGIYKDNKGDFLPRPHNPGNINTAVSDKYINKEYQQLKKADNSQFKLLEALKEYSLYAQEGKNGYSKLYLDIPRYSINDTLETFQKGIYNERWKDKKALIGLWWDKKFGKAVDDDQNGLNYDANNNLVNTDLYGDEVARVPVTGLYNLDISQTSSDVLGGLFKYTLSLENQSKLVENLPLVNSLLDTLKAEENQPKNIEAKTLNKFTGKLNFPNKKGGTNARLGQIKSLIEREVFGQVVSDFDQANPVLSKVMNGLQKMSSRSSLALNVPAALKNRYGQIVQNIIEASGSEFVSLKDLALARPWAFKMMVEWSAKGIYTKGKQSLNVQMIEQFDPTFRTKDQTGKSVSRSMFKDLLNGEYLMSVNKFGEMEAALQLYGGFMHGQKVQQVTSDGKTTININYIDAWELDSDGELTLKKGIDPEWGSRQVYHTYTKDETLEEIAKRYYISVEDLKAKNKITDKTTLTEGQELVIAKGVKFKLFRNKFQAVSRKLFGAYDQFGQSEGTKYLGYRMFFFMRKWVVPMFVNKLGTAVDTSEVDSVFNIHKVKFKPRYDWALGKTTQGYYITTLQVLRDLIKSKGQKFQYMTDQEKSDLKRSGMDVLSIIGLALLTGLLFGYDDDDEERWAKMKERSGAIGTDNFRPGGFFANHLLYLMMGVQSETSTFIPLPKIGDVSLGLDDYTKFITSSSVAFGNTLNLYASILQDTLNFLTFNDAGRYAKKAGPFGWQEKEDLKIWGHLYKTIGFTGSSGDPETLIKNLERSSIVK